MTDVLLSTSAAISHRDTESLTGCIWRLRAADERQAALLMQRFGLPEVVARILAARGIAVEEAGHFLSPSLKAQLPDPFHLKDMDKAVARLMQAIHNKETIAIFGDYDVDGATSAALLASFFRSVGSEPLFYIPDRMKEGYGPNPQAMHVLKGKGAALVITVDCGALAFEALEEAATIGLDVIVVDHHQGESKLPKACAVINPNRVDETSPHKHLAAVGVAFLLAVAVNSKLREAGFYSSPIRGEDGRGAQFANAQQVSPHPNPPPNGEGTPEPDLKQWLDLVALGTVCDVVPLIGVNRAFVAQGLKVMAARKNLGIRTLLDLAGIDQKPGVFHAGFVLGPRINAGGRVGQSDLGVQLLTCSDESRARELAGQLDLHNRERKAIESAVLEEALAEAEKQADSLLIMLAGKGWHPGVIGIVAGRVKEAFHRPVAVIAMENGVGKASARSVTGFDMGAAVIAARDSGLLLAGGGHAMAAGFTVAEEKLSALQEFLSERAAKQAELLARKKLIRLDAELALQGITQELVEKLEQLAPFGQGNPSVHVAVRGVVNMKPQIVGELHVRTFLKDPAGGGSLSAIAFRTVDTRLGEALFATRGQKIDLAGQLRVQEWMGRRSVSLMIEDIASAGAK